MSLKHIRAAAFAFAAAVAVPAAAPAEAGLRDSLDNARDALGCTAKAVFNPMRVVESTMRNFERMTHKEFDRKANRSVKEAQEECRIALKSIVARGFGVKPVRTAADKIKKAAGKAREAAGKVASWFGKDSAPGDRRRALAIGGGERRFYKDAGVLGAKPLPKAKAPVPPADGDPGSPGGWDEAAAPAPDPWAADEDRTARSGVWDPPAEDRDPWGAAESAARDPFAPDPDVDGDGGEAADEAEGGGYADALAALERRAEEARRQAEREAELARQQAEREAEMARRREEAEQRRAEQEAELARQRKEAERRQARREAELARQREREEEAEYARRERENDRRRSGGSGLFGSGSGSGSRLFSAESLSQALRDLEERNARERERQQRENERQRRQWEEQQERQRQSANRQRQETERQRRQQQAQQERQRQLAERQRQQQEAERERERQRQEAERRQRQEAERRRREEERRREAERRQRRQAALAGSCVQFRRLKGGFNVSDIEARSTCGYGVQALVACAESPGNSSMPFLGGSWTPVPWVERCRQGPVVLGACRAGTGLYPARLAGGRYTCR